MENLRFKQSLLNFISNQKKANKKTTHALVTSSIRVGVVAKNDDDIYIIKAHTQV